MQLLDMIQGGIGINDEIQCKLGDVESILTICACLFSYLLQYLHIDRHLLFINAILWLSIFMVF